MQTSNDDSLANDILRGAEEIAAYARLKVRDAYFKLEKGYLPGRKEGNIWTSTKSLLRAHYNTPTNLRPPDTSTEPEPSNAAASPPRAARSGRPLARRGTDPGTEAAPSVIERRPLQSPARRGR